jgi:hypothetical protein
MSVETGYMNVGYAFLAGGSEQGWNLSGFQTGQFNALDLQASGVGVDDDFSDSQAVFGFQSPPSSTSDDINHELSYQVVVQNTGGEGTYQIMWLTIT